MTTTHPLVVGMDIATHCGIAIGRTNAVPGVTTWDLSEGGKGRPRRLAELMSLCDSFFVDVKPDYLFYEAGMTLQVALSIGTSDDTFAFLRGAIGVVEACAVKAMVPYIEAIEVQEARRHLLGGGRIPKGEGKKLVLERCRMLRWPANNTDESDACAIWSFGCGKANPRVAHLTTPLFLSLIHI